MPKVYDPILCMMVEQPAMKARDAEPLKKGQKYKNRNGVVVEIITVEPNYVLADFGGVKKDFTPYGLQKILSDNGYVKTKDARTVDAAASDFQQAMAKLEEVQRIVTKYGRKIDASAMHAMLDRLKGNFKYYIENAGKGWYD